MTTEQIRARLDEINARQEAIEAEAESKNSGKFTAEQREEYDRLSAEFKHLNQPLPRRAAMNSNEPFVDGQATPQQRWTNTATGEEVATYRPGESIAAYDVRSDDLSIGRFLQAKATGNWNNAGAEHAAMVSAMSESTGTGGFMVPQVLSGMFLDLMRASSVVFNWGATTVEMTSDRMRIAGLNSDATYSAVGENQLIPESAMTFRSIGLTARKFGTIVRMSRELVEDAPNAPSVIEDALRAAFRVELDRLFLLGNGGADGIIGLTTIPDIDETTSVGAIAWEDLHNAAIAIRSANHQPNGYILSPTIAGDLDLITSGDGTNSAKMWLGPPPSLKGLNRLETTAIGDATAIVGDGSRLIVGMRRAIQVDFSTEANEAFERDQLLMRITTRLDLAATHNAAFHILRGITT